MSTTATIPTDYRPVGDRPDWKVPPVNPTAPLTQLATEIATDAQTLAGQHLTLMKAELRETVHTAIRAAVYAAIGGAVMAVGGLFLVVGLVLLTAWLFPALPVWAAWLIWGGGLMLIAGIALLVAYRLGTHLDVVPRRTIRSFKESWSCLVNRLS